MKPHLPVHSQRPARTSTRRPLAARRPIVRTGNPEEDRTLADLAGRDGIDAVALLLAGGANLLAPGLDGGTPLHQAAWFGQPGQVRQLLAFGAPLEVFDPTHGSSVLGWAVHGARFSGGADERAADYESIVTILLEAGARQRYPGDDGDAYRERLLGDAPPGIEALLSAATV